MSLLKHDAALALSFLLKIYPQGLWSLSAIEPDTGKIETRSIRAGADADVARFLEQHAIHNIYYSINTPLRAIDKKLEKTDIAAARFLHVDVDPRAGEDLDAERQRIRAVLESPPAPIPRPSIVVFSGGGYNALWRLAEPFEVGGNIERALEIERYNIRLEIVLGGDHCHNVDRIARLPGTVNYPDSRKRKKGRVSAMAELAWFEDAAYPLSAFSQAAPIQLPGQGIGSSQTRRRTFAPGNVRRLANTDELPDGVANRTKMLIVQGCDPDDPAKWQSRSETLYHVCCELVRAGCADELIYAVITDPGFKISASVLDKGSSVERYALRQIERARENAVDPWLADLNERHAVISNIGGACRVIEEVEDPVLRRRQLTIQTFTDFRNRYMNQRVTVGEDKDGNSIKMPVGAWWLEHEQRRQHDAVVFAPGAADVGNNYNLWRGFKYEPIPGDRHLPMLAHVRDNICGGLDEIYNYVIGWMARAVQHPDTPGEVAIVMRGKMGTGKSLFAKCFGELFGRHFLHISNAQHLVGNFNAQLRDAVVVFADEAFYAGDKKHESVLKTLITEETLMIERKGVDAEQAPNYVHLIMASNSEWVAPAGPNERRYLVIDVGNERLQDTDYHGRWVEQLRADGGKGYGSLLHFLQHVDLRTFNVRRVPRTRALVEQKLLSMPSEQEWFYGRLDDGVMPGGGAWTDPILKRVVIDSYLTYAQRIGGNRRATETMLGRFLHKACGDGLRSYIASHVYRSDGVESRERAAFYQFPALEQCRTTFERHFGGPYDWRAIIEERHNLVPAIEAF